MTTPFVTNDDINELKKCNIAYETDVIIFLTEIRKYFNTHWRKEFYIKDEISSIDELNKEHLLDYPSTGGYHVLEDSFTGPCQVNLLSEKSKTILGYLYGINLH